MTKTIAQHWEDIFKEHNIINQINNNGFFDISARKIKEHKEPRLMTKFDSENQLPEIFKNNKLSILPIDNGLYRIGHYKAYTKLPNDDVDAIEVEFPNHIETIDPDNVYSEANALHIATLTGMFSNILNEEMNQTISGRMRTNNFNFVIDKYDGKQATINVKSPQIEIDGGYEGQSKVLLIEAKNYKPQTFIIRQLYYPYRYWLSKVNKPVATFFFVYESGIYHIYNYRFIDNNHYNSLKLIEHKAFVVKYENSINALKDIVYNTSIKYKDSENDYIFPQANNISRIFKTLSLLEDNELTAKELAEQLEMKDRQGAYYGDACLYLRLIDKIGTKYKINELGLKIIQSESKKRNNLLAQEISSHSTFNLALKNAFENEKHTINVNECIKLMKKTGVNLGTEGMYKRRASTIKSWIEWILNSNL